MPVKMIVTDLDKTLLRTDKTISDDTASALNRCKEKGMRIVFATARPERATKQFQHRILPDHVIANNGATIHSGEIILQNLLIPSATRDALIPALLRAAQVSLITVEAGHCVYTNYDGPPWETGWNVVYADFADGFFEDTPKVSAECKDPDDLRKLLGAFPELHLYSNTGETWHQIMHKDSTKINAIRYLADMHGIFMEDVVAFGDDYNDMDMLRHCGIGVAMANAIDEVKAAADCVCASNDSDGVAKWLQRNALM